MRMIEVSITVWRDGVLHVVYVPVFVTNGAAPALSGNIGQLVDNTPIVLSEDEMIAAAKKGHTHG